MVTDIHEDQTGVMLGSLRYPAFVCICEMRTWSRCEVGEHVANEGEWNSLALNKITVDTT